MVILRSSWKLRVCALSGRASIVLAMWGGTSGGVDSKYVCRSVGVGWEMGLREVEGGGAAGGGKVEG